MAAEPHIYVADRSIWLESPAFAAKDSGMTKLPASSSSMEPEMLARSILGALGGSTESIRTATLVLPASWCYVHRFPIPQRRPTHAMLAYAFEEYLPVEVEQLTCDFVRATNGDYFGVGIETARTRRLLDTLAARDLTVAHLRVDVLDAAGRITFANRLLWCDDEHVACLRQCDRCVEEWRVVRLAPDVADEQWCERVTDHLDLEEADALTIAGCVASERLTALASRRPGSSLPSSDAARRHSSALNIDLACDALASETQRAGLHRAWRRTAAVSLLGLLILAGALFVHRGRLQHQVESVAAWERSVFTELFPRQAVPTGIALRLASERRRLEGLTLARKPGAAGPTDALATLHGVVAALPRDLRVDLQDLRVEGSDVTLRGRLRDHRQAEQLATAIETRPAVDCDAPRTDRLKSGGVQFFLHARAAAPEARP